MWNACGKALSAIAAVLIGTAVSAQTYPNKLNADSVDPASDAAYIREMQQRMDRIHRTEHRPTVALVLSGGGAKGSAHVGVLRKLEEMQIPIDLICGTSMGGLVGGLYAMGYPASYLDTLLRSQDWGFTLTDKVDQKYIPYSSKEYKSRYLISIPFHYDKKDVSEDREARLLLDADSEELTTRTGVNTLASSLPSGYVYGFNVNNLISSLTVGYQDSISFASLPIPYYSVAADIVSCKAKNWGSGSVKEAMRSTMSIPGMFDPVRTDGMVLVDGGVRNNFPVDLARAMGADYVIGVELSGSAPDFDQVKNLGNILMQFIKMLGKDAFDKNTPNVDVFIKPDLDGFNMLSFSDVAIDTMINRGYTAACAHNDELQVIKDHMKDAVPRLNNRKATDLSENTVLVSSISFNGLTDDESKILMDKIGLRVGTYLNKKDMDSAMSKLQATGSFESVTYSLLGSGEPYRLEFDCVKAPTHKVGVGFRVDSHEWASILLNLGLNTNKLQGSRLDIEGRIGLHRYIGAAYSLDLPRVPTFNAEVKYTSTYGDILGNTGIPNYNISVNSHKELLYISNIKGTKSDLRIGIQNYWFKTRTLMADEQNIMAFEDMDGYTSGDFLSAFADAKLYTLDDRYFPTRGFTFKGKAEWVFARSGSCPEESRRIPVIALDYMQAIPLGRSVSFISDLHVRNIFEQHNALCFANIAGGSIYGHYLDHQIPFVGFHQTYIGYNHMAVANLELRVNPVGNFYISALGGALQQGTTFKEEFTSTDKMIIGAGLRASYDSLFGPVRADVSWSSLTKKAGFFISAGFDF